MRHNLRENESERKREYRMHEKVEGGEKVVGELGEDLDQMGGAGEIRREREAYAASRRRVMPDLSNERE